MSLAKMVNPGDMVFRYRGEAEGRKGLAAVLDQQRLELQDSCRDLPDKIMGMIWHIITVGIDEGIPLPTLVQETTVEGFVRKREDDARELRTMYERISEYFY